MLALKVVIPYSSLLHVFKSLSLQGDLIIGSMINSTPDLHNNAHSATRGIAGIKYWLFLLEA